MISSMGIKSYRSGSLCVLLICAVLLVAGGGGAAGAATIDNVNNTDYSYAETVSNTDGKGCTLRKALANAMNGNGAFTACKTGSSGPDTIAFSDAADFTLGTRGFLDDITKDITITAPGPKKFVGINTGTGKGEIFRVVGADAKLTMDGFTLTNAGNGAITISSQGHLSMSGGTFDSNTTAGDGGAISGTGTISLTAIHFTNNSAPGGSGGAISLSNDGSGGISSITNSFFDGNTADKSGGAIYYTGASSGTLALTNIIFGEITGNTAAATEAGDPCNKGGGAIFTDSGGLVTIFRSAFLDNEVTGANGCGGAIFSAYTSSAMPLVVQHSVFGDPLLGLGNIVNGGTNGKGGAIYSRKNIVVLGSSFISNDAKTGKGGAIASDVLPAGVNPSWPGLPFSINSLWPADTGAFIGNSTFNDNSAGSGGAIYSFGQGSSREITLVNVTIAGNIASDANGGGGTYNTGTGTVRLSNTIVSNNTANGVAQNCGGTSPAVVNTVANLQWEPGQTNTCAAASPIPVGNPRLKAPAVVLPDVLTFVMTLNTGSKASNAGNNDKCQKPPIYNLDQRSLVVPVRPAGGPNCDIGAYESDMAPTVAPTVAKSFSPRAITKGGTSTLTIAFGNANAGAATLSSLFTDTLPSGMTIDNPNNLGGTCPGTKTAVAGGNKITYAGGAKIPAGGCTIKANVTSSTVGTSTNTVAAGALKTDLGNNPTAASANLIIKPFAPTVAKGFSPGTINKGGTSTLTITFGNANAGAVTLSALFTDTLPSGMTIDNPNNLGGTCPGTKTAVIGGNKITYAGGAKIPAGGCTIKANVTSTTLGTSTNTIAAGALKTNLGNNATAASANLFVKARPTVAKGFSPGMIAPGGTSTVTITFGNANAGAATLSSLFTDTLPSGMTIDNPNNLGGTCPGTKTAVIGGNKITYAGGAKIPAGGCTIKANVTSSAVGTLTNTIAAGALKTNLGSNATAASASLVIKIAAPTVAKGFSPRAITKGGTSTLTIAFGNANAGAATLSSLFTDTLPSGMTIDNPNNLGGTCPGTKTAVIGGNKITYAGGAKIPAGGCTIKANVTGTTLGTSTNTIAAGALKTNLGNNPTAASANLFVKARPTVAKGFSPGMIAPGGTSTLTITFGNANASAATLSSLFTDTLPSGMTIDNPNNLGGTCPGTKTAVIGGNKITYAGGAKIPAGGCTIKANVTSSAVGTLTNTIAAGALKTNLGSNATAASASLVILIIHAP